MPSRLPLLLAVLGLAVACSSDASAETPPLSGATTTVPPATAASAFVDCMAEQGVVLEGIEVGPDGRPLWDPLAGQLELTSPEVAAALTRCGSILERTGLLALPEERAAEVRRRLGLFSSCLREEGVEGFPDPDPAYDGTAPPYPPELIPRDDPELAAAVAACRSVVVAE